MSTGLYDANFNAISSHVLAVTECRNAFLRGRVNNETAAQYRQRVTPTPFPGFTARKRVYPTITIDHIGGPIRLTLHVAGGPTVSTEVTPTQAVTLGAQLCALGADALNGR